MFFSLTELIERESLNDQIIRTAVAQACFQGFVEPNAIPRDNAAFKQRVQAGSAEVITGANNIEQAMRDSSEALHDVNGLLTKKRKHFAEACEDIDNHLKRLFAPEFLCSAGYGHAIYYGRYVGAIKIRLDRLATINAAADAENCKKLASVEQRLEKLLYNYPYATIVDQHVRDYRWLIEELRVSMFAQQLKTMRPVSLPRVEKAWQQIELAKYPLMQR